MKNSARFLAALLLSIWSAASFTADAQKFHLPATHAREHADLIANQRPMSGKAKAEADRRLLEDVRRREALDDSEIFGQYWESDRVNPYGNIAIPAEKNIDVSEFVMPVKGCVTSRYGWRARFGRMHRGIDLNLNVGDTVKAAFSGKVRLCKYEARGYGYYVVIRHDNGMETVYGHLSRFIVKPNQRVKAGDPIALGGNTGRSTGPHLHFETRYLGLAINPEALIDFESGATHKDVFAFNKANYDKSQNYRPSRKGAKMKKASARKSSRKATASSKKKRGGKRRR